MEFIAQNTYSCTLGGRNFGKDKRGNFKQWRLKQKNYNKKNISLNKNYRIVKNFLSYIRVDSSTDIIKRMSIAQIIMGDYITLKTKHPKTRIKYEGLFIAALLSIKLKEMNISYERKDMIEFFIDKYNYFCEIKQFNRYKMYIARLIKNGKS